MAGAILTAMQITLFGRAAELLASWRARNVASARRQRCENRVETLNHFLLPADHHAITAFQSPDAAAGADVNVMNFFRRQFLGATDIIHVVGVASVNEN